MSRPDDRLEKAGSAKLSRECAVPRALSRRTVLKSALGVGVSLQFAGRAVSAAEGPRKVRPQVGDLFVFSLGDRQGQIITLQDLPSGGPPVIAYPLDPSTQTVRDGSRLNRVLLVRLTENELAEQTRMSAAEGIVGYSAICTHTGCDVVGWKSEIQHFVCPCHSSTLAPLVAHGKVMVGVSGGELGIRGFVQAFDAETGKSVWKTYTVPGPGEAGNESWPNDTWKTGGVPVWITGSYDPQLNLTYWGTGNVGPFMGEVRPGDNLYANSVIALDADTGALKAYHQYHWNDSWDWDEVSAPILLDVQRNGRSIKALVHAARNGYLWLLERSADKITFVEAKPYVRQNVFTKLDPETGRPTYDPQHVPGIGKRVEFCPSVWGGKDWPPEAYNPKTGYVYIPANENRCGALTGKQATYIPGQLYIGVEFADIELLPQANAKKHIGELQAWDLNTGKQVWMAKFKSHNWGPVLTTGGGLVFLGGTNDRYFRAFDAKTGKLLWQQRTNSGVTGVPSSYQIDGVQYIAVQSGWGVDAQRKQELLDKAFGSQTFVPQGGVLWVFALARS